MNVLFLTHRLPYAPNRGDRVRAYHLLRVLRARASVTLISLVHDDEEAAQVSSMTGLADHVHAARVPRVGNWIRGACSLPSERPLTHALLASGEMPALIDAAVRRQRPDVVLAYCSGIAQYALRPPLAGLPLVVDMLDVDSQKWLALSRKSGIAKNWIYARETRTLGAFERLLTDRAFATVVVNERERGALAAMAPDARIEIIGLGVDIDGLAPPEPPCDSLDVVFCGVMNYAPNAEGAVWLGREVWPLVRQALPAARLLLVGSQPGASVRALASDDVIVTGTVPDVRPFLWNAAVAAAPLQTARGVQNKVLEALAAGLPTVVTPVVAEGLPPEVAAVCRQASSPREFADALIALLKQSPLERRAIARAVDLSPMSWARTLEPLADLLAEAAEIS